MPRIPTVPPAMGPSSSGGAAATGHGGRPGAVTNGAPGVATGLFAQADARNEGIHALQRGMPMMWQLSVAFVATATFCVHSCL